MIDNEKLNRLLLNLTEAKAAERVEAAKLVDTSNAHKAQEVKWKNTNEVINVHQKALDDFIRDQTIAEAKRLNGEPVEDLHQQMLDRNRAITGKGEDNT